RGAGPHLAILAGGGLNAQTIMSTRQATNIREFHVGRAARAPAATGGVVQAALVRELAGAMEAVSDQS
ncbi:MAG: hypothetical protein ACRD68_16080, partial [Pyrinomonadaceae bacterium]